MNKCKKSQLKTVQFYFLIEMDCVIYFILFSYSIFITIFPFYLLTFSFMIFFKLRKYFYEGFIHLRNLLIGALVNKFNLNLNFKSPWLSID